MSSPSPRNPNICLNCEQLLEDDCAELERLMGEPDGPPPANRLRENVRRQFDAQEFPGVVESALKLGA